MKLDVESNGKILAGLWEIKEWMAYGFYEAVEELPWPRAFGRAFLRLYENMEIRIPEENLLIPCEPFPVNEAMERKLGGENHLWHMRFDHIQSMKENKAHHATGFICDFMHNCGLHINPEMIGIKKKQYPQHAELMDAFAEDFNQRLPHFGGYTHSNPDISRVVNEGFDAMARELDGQLEEVAKEGLPQGSPEYNLLVALKEYTDGVKIFHRRTVNALEQVVENSSGERKDKLLLILENLRSAFIKPAENFIQGLLAVNFAWMLDGCDSIGRVDQVLGDLFEKDIKNGTLEMAFARELLDEFFFNFERLNGWNLQIGGYRPDGTDGCNLLTEELLKACGRNHFRRPNVAFRITRSTPDSLVKIALEALKNGSGRPALYNDDLYIHTLSSMDLGLIPEDAREMGFGGCTETMISGMSNVGCLGDCDINLAKVLELALYNGYDPVQKSQDGPHTGRFEAFESFGLFLDAFKKQLKYLTDNSAAYSKAQLKQRFTRGDPKLYRTFFTRDCVKNRKSFEAGGARYNWVVVSYQGIANTIDSLAAIKKYVFEEKSISPELLINALRNDFSGYEDVRSKLLAAPRYGNDIDFADTIGQEVLEFAWQELYKHETPRGGRYIASCILFDTYAEAGKCVGALPDGRCSGEVLTDSVGPAQGRDTHGPTAMMNSVIKLSLQLAVGTPVLNIRIQKKLLSENAGMEAYTNLIRTYFSKGGLQIQVSVISREDMLAAQKEPEKYRDLIVRVGGFSEYFTNLNYELQKSVLARTEY